MSEKVRAINSAIGSIKLEVAQRVLYLSKRTFAVEVTAFV
jgi:hypothetical protein